MPSDDLVLNVQQIAGYPQAGVQGADAVVLQRGGLGGPYYSVSAETLVGDALIGAGPLNVGNAAPADSDGGEIYFDNLVTPLGGWWGWNVYFNTQQTQARLGTSGSSAIFRCDETIGWQFLWSSASGALAFNMSLCVSPSGYLKVGEQVMLGRDPASPMEAATAQWVQAAISSSLALLQSLYSTATVWSFNQRTGNIILNLCDVMGAGGAPIFSPVFQGSPTAPSPPPADSSNALATTAWVWQAVNSHLAANVVSSFNTRIGAVVLTSGDISGAGGALSTDLAPYALLAGPSFSGNVTAPTAPPGTNSGQVATTAFVHAAVTASTTGVASFNTRTGAVVLATADITGAGGAVLVSPVFSGTPQAPTAPPGTNNQQIATTAFVLASNVTSFNTRTGAIVLTGADVTGAGGAVLASPAFTGTPTAPTAAPGTNNTQLATTAFVANVIAGGLVSTFNGRSGAVSLIANDVSAAGGALLASPTFSGVPAGPTAAPGTNTTQLSTTAFVAAAIAAAGGVTSFNGRAGVVTLATADITGAGGALLASPAFSGTPTAPTATAGTNSTQLATTAFVMAAIRQPATVAPLMDGTAAVGTSLLYARQDHVHPTDTSRAAQSSLANYLPLTGGTLTGTLYSTAGTALNTSGAISTGTITSSAGITSTAGTVISQSGSTSNFVLSNASGAVRGSVYHDGNSLYGNNNIGNGQWYVTNVPQFVVNCTPYCPGGGPWSAVSDARIKTVESEYADGLAQILGLRPVVYRYKGNDADSLGGKSPQASAAEKRTTFVGLIAQEVEAIFPGMVSKREAYIDGEKVDDMRDLNTTPLIYALVNAVKELASRLEKLEAIT